MVDEQPQQQENKKYKILVVEDDVFMVDLLTHELNNAGLDTVVARNGKEGVDKYQESKPDLVLSDLLLPDQKGFDVIRQIRRTPGGPEAKVIILSNLSEEGDIAEGQRLGVNAYLVKANTSLPEIVQKVKEVLGTAAAKP
jgi:CheY-like chemotaxis protein